MPADGSVRLAFACVEINDSDDDSDRGERLRLRELVGQVLASPTNGRSRMRRNHEIPAPADIRQENRDAP